MTNRFFRFFLKQFDDSDYVLSQKAHSLFYLSLGFVVADLAYLLFFLAQKRYDSAIMIIILLFFCFMVLLLFYFRKGRFMIFSHVLLIVTITCLWTVSFLEHGQLFQKSNNLPLILGAMSILPLLFIKTGKEILFYYLINVLVIFFFVLHLQSEFSLADAERNEFLVDSFIAFSFVAFFSYRFFRIYQKALEKAKEAEKAIQDQYRNLEASTEEMEVMNDELVSIHNEVLESSQRLAEEKERLAITLDSIDDGVITFDVRGMITSVNQAAEDILSMDKSRLESGNVAEVFRLKDAGNVEIQNDMKAGILERGENYEFKDDIVLATGDGVQKIISGKAVPLYDLNGKITGGVVAFRDITQQKRIQDEFIKSSKIESLGVFAGGIAHDFNNLLTAILGCISIARLNLESDNHNVEFLVEAEKASLSAKGLTQQLLSFSKGGAPIKALSSLKGIIRETSGFVLSGSRLQCVYDLQDDLWNAEVDKGQISQVIHNITLNARQTMRDAGTIRISARNVNLDGKSGMPLPEGRYLRVAIADEGEGIAPELITRIFDPFFSTKSEGSGLGLAVTASIIKNHNGYITVNSTPGHGTEFEFYLPASISEKEEESGESFSDDLNNLRILIMDDDKVVLRVGENMLKRLGCEVVTTIDGESAIQIYRDSLKTDHPFDVLIMDLTVPGAMGGKDAISVIRDLNPDICAIVSSGYSNDPVMSMYGSYGFRGYIVKPYKIEDLRQAIINALS